MASSRYWAKSNALEAALAYARKGWHVLPLHSVRNGRCTCPKEQCGTPGKHPRIKSGPDHGNASIDEQTIRRWWRKWPDTNVGIVTGARSGLVVLDVDPRHDGNRSLREFETQHGSLPDTPTVLTGGGGLHLYFAHPGRRVENKVGFMPGLDIRGDGGLVVAPPSLHIKGRRYEWK